MQSRIRKVGRVCGEPGKRYYSNITYDRGAAIDYCLPVNRFTNSHSSTHNHNPDLHAILMFLPMPSWRPLPVRITWQEKKREQLLGDGTETSLEKAVPWSLHTNTCSYFIPSQSVDFTGSILSVLWCLMYQHLLLVIQLTGDSRHWT